MKDRDRIIAMMAPFIAIIVVIMMNIFVQVMIG